MTCVTFGGTGPAEDEGYIFRYIEGFIYRKYRPKDSIKNYHENMSKISHKFANLKFA